MFMSPSNSKMEKLLKYCLSGILFIGLLIACQPSYDMYKKEITVTDHVDYAEYFIGGRGNYYQGSAGEQTLIEEAAKYNPEHPEVWRERGIPYLKRGIASGFYPPYKECITRDSLNWIGYRGYCYLYFYRDYERALSDFNATDKLTPNFIDHPQAQSVDFMRAICYLRMQDFETALQFIDQHIAEETRQVGQDYIESISFLYKGMAHQQLGQLDEAQAAYELGIEIHDQNADLEFYLATLLLEKGEQSAALSMLEKAKKSFLAGYSNNRSYVEEFYQVYWADLMDLEQQLNKSRSI